MLSSLRHGVGQLWCETVRILVVAEQYPWPAKDGYRRRLDHVVRGLTRVGEVHVIALHRPGTADPVDPGIEGVTTIAVPTGPDRGLRQWFRPWLTSSVPRRLFGPDWSMVRATITAEVRSGGAFDLVWFSHVDTWWALHDHVSAGAYVVDFDNLENLALRLRRRIPPRVAPGSSLLVKVSTVARWVMSRLFDVVDERRWDRMQRRCAKAVDVVVVCSELDVVRSGCDNSAVIGNGSDDPDVVHEDRSLIRSDVPTMLFVGAIDYEPNTDAVEWFVREVFGSIRHRVPGATVRFVGRGSSQVAWVREVDGVELVGHVDDLQPELDRADVSIVPIRVGAGTRLKVVEALANRIPIVTTAVGCEGIDVIDGRHVMIADDADAFADACVRLLQDGDARQSLADEGADLFDSTYDWEIIERRLADLVRQVVATP